MRSTAYVALGSNLGNRRAYIASAVESLKRLPNVAGLELSGVIETDPVDVPAACARFLNAVARVRFAVDRHPHLLLAELIDIEQGLGRKRSARNAARTIDLDLLMMDDLVVRSETLVLPHPRLHDRVFVLDPLVQLDPDLIHPTLRRTMRELRATLKPGDSPW